MEKVKVSREAAEALELMKAKGAPLNEIVERHVCSDLIIVNGWENVRLLPTDTLIRALYIGYEVEQSPEEKVLAYYNDMIRQRDETPYPAVASEINGQLAIIRTVLNLLEKNIEGVNA